MQKVTDFFKQPRWHISELRFMRATGTIFEGTDDATELVLVLFRYFENFNGISQS